ncbi:26S proteasome non-ATPase regulatory subunit 9 [Copidosoma floridanum]|uniref:26S proteasome non-ATPase regulatory subunit 9 n=1 Tax=Copidosoma floridanum TaxID=29053 RepID=UPI0006C9D081|nr:26S proteasome non-ATPase regulatory subunit 9 [Copidosoma floridanum]XP_023245270.1 26S proteasome non-ATPase regulatory subunit 9 [Copidosoma floridanum]
MVVDTELEEAKEAVLQLMKEKEKIEAELASANNILSTNGVSMTDELTDSQGYPRNDINVYQVRHARHKIICLQNDHKAIMQKIERGLHKVHQCAGIGGTANAQEETPATSSGLQDGNFLLEPFLRVNLVSPGSPAELAGIQTEDLILEFGSITSSNFNSLKDIGSIVENSRYKNVAVKIKRGSNTFALTLIPRPWSGKGLLGCNVVPLESVER